jgi:hypothetical protein
MRWNELFVGMTVLVGFWLLKLLAELVWEGLKARLRRELLTEPAPVSALPTGSIEVDATGAKPDESHPAG